MTKVNFTEEDLKSYPINMDDFKAYLELQNYSECSKKAYVDGLECFMRHGFSEVSFLNGNLFKEMLIAENKKGKTINLWIAALNVYHRWKRIPGIEAIKINKDPFVKNGMELDDYFYLLDCLLKDKRYSWYVITKLLASTGMRIGEAVKVTYGDLRKGSCMVYGKGGKPRTVMFSHNLRETLYMYIKNKPDNEKVIPYDQSYVRTAYINMKKKYHLNVCCSPHEFRRFFARQMYETTHDEALVKGLLGHESLSMTYHYIRKTEKQALTMFARAQNW